jgi:TniQ
MQPQSACYPVEWLEEPPRPAPRAPRLPLLATPLPEEALPSWLHRFAHELDASPVELLLEDEPEELLHDDTWWRKPPEGVLERLAERTGIPVPDLKRLTFADWERRYPAVDEVTRRFARSRVGDRPLHPYPTRRYVVCPACLALDPLPYLRKQWTLGWYAVCLEHGLVMKTGCTECFPAGALVLPPLKSAHWRRTELCSRCLASLIHQPACQAHPLAVELQRSLLERRKSGVVDWLTIGRLDWEVAIALIDLILQLFWIGSTWEVRKGYYEHIEDELELPEKLGRSSYDGLLIAAWVLEDWPARAQRVSRELKVASIEERLVRWVNMDPEIRRQLERLLDPQQTSHDEGVR